MMITKMDMDNKTLGGPRWNLGAYGPQLGGQNFVNDKRKWKTLQVFFKKKFFLKFFFFKIFFKIF